MKLSEIKEAFALSGEITDSVLLTNGGIHETYQIRTDSGKNYIFQKINRNVFANPEVVMQNLTFVTACLHSHFPDMQTLYCYQTRTGGYVYQDWRVMDFINGYSLKTVADLHQVQQAGKAFGQFQSHVSMLDSSGLIPVIPDFHNTRVYYQKLLALADDSEEFRILKNWQERACFVFDTYQKERIPLIVTHNDMKCSNLLFDRFTHQPVAVIDLDTVMSGMAVYDFGDAVRSIASRTNSGNPDLNQVGIDMDKCKAFASGWLSEMRYAEPERNLLIPAVFSVTVELAVRYLTDYLQGNLYFKADYPDQNLIKARNQIRLAQDILNHQSEMEKFIF